MKKLTLFLIILIPVITFSQIIHIPDDYPTIQAGIEAANNGDTVLVEQGVYYENINFNGKAIFIASNYIFEPDSNHIYNTIINGSQPIDPDIGTVVTFDSNTDTISCLYGFTITAGTGTKMSYIFPNITGGGIFFSDAGGKLVSNIIENNECILDTLDGGVYGGGIASGPHGTDHLMVIRRNIIQNNLVWTKGTNSSWNMGWAEGGGIQLGYNAIVEGNLIISNICKSNHGISVGGAIRICADPIASLYQALAVVKNNQIRNNESISETFGAFAGGISCSAGNTIIESNEIINNSVESQNYCRGAGLYFDLVNSYYAIVNNNFILDNVNICGSSNGGAIGLYRSIDIEICNNLILNNATDNGGAFSISKSQPRLISNNTILNNSANLAGSAFYIIDTSYVEVLNSILRNDSVNGAISEIYVQNLSTLSVQYSNIMGDWAGQGNIDVDPLFLGSGNYPYSLSVGSPCIDEGIPDTTGLNLPFLDIIGNKRIWDGDNNGTAIIDMGAYEYGSIPVGLTMQNIPNSLIEINCYPVPFSKDVTFSFYLSTISNYLLEIRHINGQLISTIINEVNQKGEKYIVFDGSELKPGVYFCVLKTSEGIQTRKIIKL